MLHTLVAAFALTGTTNDKVIKSVRRSANLREICFLLDTCEE